MSAANRVLVTCRQMQVELPEHEQMLRAQGYELVVPELIGQQLSAGELIPLMAGVVGFIAGDDEITAEVLDQAPDLKVLVRWGIGMDSVDIPAAEARGIQVTNTPGVFDEEVADSALGYMLNLARGHHAVDALVRGGAWPKVEGFTLAGATVGVVGLGGIGRAITRRCAAFGMRVVAFDPYLRTWPSADAGVDRADELDDLLRMSRFVVLACPATPETHHLIDASALKTMTADAYLINVARGSVVDEPALVEALQNGTIAGAGLDVFEVEPLPSTSPLRTLERVLLGAHNGSNTREGVARASAVAVDKLLQRLRGEA